MKKNAISLIGRRFATHRSRPNRDITLLLVLCFLGVSNTFGDYQSPFVMATVSADTTPSNEDGNNYMEENRSKEGPHILRNLRDDTTTSTRPGAADPDKTSPKCEIVDSSSAGKNLRGDSSRGGGGGATLTSSGISKPYVPLDPAYAHLVFVIYEGRLWERKKTYGEWTWIDHYRPTSEELTTTRSPLYVGTQNGEYAYAFDINKHLWKKKLPYKKNKSYIWTLVGTINDQELNLPYPLYSDMVVSKYFTEGGTIDGKILITDRDNVVTVSIPSDEWNVYLGPRKSDEALDPLNTCPLGLHASNPPLVAPNRLFATSTLWGDHPRRRKLWMYVGPGFIPASYQMWQYHSSPLNGYHDLSKCGAYMDTPQRRFFCIDVDAKMVSYTLPNDDDSWYDMDGVWDNFGYIDGQPAQFAEFIGVPVTIGDGGKLHLTRGNEVIELYRLNPDTWVWYNHGQPPTGDDNEVLSDVAGAKYGSFVSAKTSKTLWERVYQWNDDGDVIGWVWVDHGHP